MKRIWLRWAVVLVAIGCFAATSHSQGLRERLRPRTGDEQGNEARPRRPLLRGVVDRLTDAVGDQGADVNPGEANGAAGGNLLEGLLPLLGGEAAGAEPLDARRLNEAIDQKLAAPLVEEIEPLERLELRFDEEQTDFRGDRLGMFGGMHLRRTPWQAPCELALNVHASIESFGSHGPRALVTVEVDLLTDTVQMFEAARQMAIDQLRRRGDASPDDLETLALLESTPPFQTLSDVADFLPRLGEVNLRNANHKIQALKSQLAHARDPVEERHLIDALAEAYRDRDNLLAFSIRPRRNPALAVDQIEVNLPGGGVSYKMADVDSIHMLITPGSVQGQVSLSFGQAAVVFYRGAKAVLLEPALRRIQQREPATLDSLRQRGRQFSEELNLSPPRSKEAEELPAPQAK